jgi:hypothetical protein
MLTTQCNFEIKLIIHANKKFGNKPHKTVLLSLEHRREKFKLACIGLPADAFVGWRLFGSSYCLSLSLTNSFSDLVSLDLLNLSEVMLAMLLFG